jgi:hypothetical protein
VVLAAWVAEARADLEAQVGLEVGREMVSEVLEV